MIELIGDEPLSADQPARVEIGRSSPRRGMAAVAGAARVPKGPLP